ncbi:MAG: general secretion pathway protein GspE [Planctomycetaceae bacterium]|jgi:hypothetical protein|nr:general secretion pathway protein GspE [Planctomycetaceae bacterium]
MAKVPVDVYRDWLKIGAENRPLNFYQLLRLERFEDDIEKIRKNYRQLNAHVRKFASGDYIEESQKLLNELAKAMLCLTDSTRKLEYDISLGRKVGVVKARRSLEEILLANQIVPPDRMKQVKSYADAVGIDLQEAVLQQKLGTQETVMLAYAESVGLPFVSIDEIGVDEEIAAQINPNTARHHSFVPLMIDRGQLLLASPKPVNPDVEEELRMIFEIPVRSTICTSAEIIPAIAKYYPRDAIQLIRKKDGTKTAATTTKTTAPNTAKTTKVEPAAPMSDDDKKKRFQTTLVVFNFTVMIVCVILVSTNIPPLSKNTALQFIVDGSIGVIVGLISGFITWNKLTK